MPRKTGKKGPTTTPDLCRLYCRAGQVGSLARASKLGTSLGKNPARPAIGKALAAEESYTLHRPVCYRVPWWKTIVSVLGEQLQCDLVYCSEYQKANNGTKHLFCCINVFSKYAWPGPLTSKWGAVTAATMQAILDEIRDELPLAMQSNKGTKMHATLFQRLLKSRDFFTSENDDMKCAVVECFQRTLQGMIHHHMTAIRTWHCVDVLSVLLCTYNSTHHRASGMAPTREELGMRLGMPVLATTTKTSGEGGRAWVICASHPVTSWTLASAGTPGSTGLSRPVTLRVSTPGKAMWSGSTHATWPHPNPGRIQ